MTSSNWNNSIAITGAGSGFGAALAHRYAADGWKVAVTDIDEDRANQTLNSIKQNGGEGFSLLLDTTSPDHWKYLEEEVLNHWGGLQILVNNAGVATAGNVEDTSMDNWDWVLGINLMGVVRGCHQFATLFKQQKAGHIVNVSSFAGLAGLPFLVSYGVAKAGVVALSEALRVEMHPYGVGVTVVCPAFVKTNLLDTFRTTGTHTEATVTHWMETSGVSAEQIANDIAKAIADNKFLLLTHAKTKTAWRLKRWLPERYFKQMVNLSKTQS